MMVMPTLDTRKLETNVAIHDQKLQSKGDKKGVKEHTIISY